MQMRNAWDAETSVTRRREANEQGNDAPPRLFALGPRPHLFALRPRPCPSCLRPALTWPGLECVCGGASLGWRGITVARTGRSGQGDGGDGWRKEGVSVRVSKGTKKAQNERTRGAGGLNGYSEGSTKERVHGQGRRRNANEYGVYTNGEQWFLFCLGGWS